MGEAWKIIKFVIFLIIAFIIALYIIDFFTSLGEKGISRTTNNLPSAEETMRPKRSW